MDRVAKEMPCALQVQGLVGLGHEWCIAGTQHEHSMNSIGVSSGRIEKGHQSAAHMMHAMPTVLPSCLHIAGGQSRHRQSPW